MVFASIREHASTAIFLRARSEIKIFALRAASSLESTTREQRALLYIFRLLQSIWKSFSLK